MQHERRCLRLRREDVSFRDVKIKHQIGNGTRRCEWRHAPEVWAEIWEKSVSWFFASEEEGWLSELAEALRRVSYVAGGRWKSQHRKIVYLSPYVEKPFNSKVLKSFIPELRNRKCFLCFVIPMLSIFELCTFYAYFTYPYHGYVTLRVTCRTLVGVASNLSVEMQSAYFTVLADWASNTICVHSLPNQNPIDVI